MTKKEILDYVMENPGNTNVSVLGPMVDAVSGVTPTGKITITENGSDIDVAQYAKADVNVSGGGDYTTATITVVDNSTLKNINASLPVQIDDGEHAGIVAIMATLKAGETTVVLYKGTGIGQIRYASSQSISASGNCELNVDPGSFSAMILITGDCTITVKDAEK